ncbi:MAG: hypothetical protein HQ556_00700 [Candidatus Marinimicrobia bacterium]|nr:hypothetical protein [Candidatus Neomarinimicrobiota bacterium]
MIEKILTGKVAIPSYLNINNFWNFLSTLGKGSQRKQESYYEESNGYGSQ